MACKESVPGTSHAKRPAPHPGPRCASCHRAVRRERTKASHDKRVCDVYGLYPGEYEAMLHAQGGKCAICQRARGVSKRLAVDHDHNDVPGRMSVRGLLCGTCNKMLGHARDDPNMFTRAYSYLRFPPAWSVLR